MEMEGLKTSDYYFDLPKELIAQDPLEDRSASRLLVMDRQTGATSHHIFKEICSFLKPGDCLVLPARLLGAKEDTGASVEILLLKRMENDVWETLVKPGKKLRPGAKVVFGDGRLRAEILDVEEDGNRLVKFFYDGIWEEVLDSLGEMPLPPYITHKLQDKNRYQTVYAKFEGSAAAPTAGLHFTKELLAQVEAMGVDIAYVTLHVGLGTFRPVKVDNVLEHHMHTEFYQVTQEAADKINRWKPCDLCRYDELPYCRERCGSGRTYESLQRQHGYLYLSGLQVQGDGRADYKLPSAGIDTGDARIRICRKRPCVEGV